MKYERLFTPIEINGMALKNRLVEAAIQLHYCPDGYANEKITEFYKARARGGVGLIIVGGCRFDDSGFSADMMSLESDEYIPSWRGFTEAVRACDPTVKIAVQLYHAGGYAKQSAIGKTAIAPSAVPSRYTGETPREMTVEEIHRLIELWAAGAVRAKAAGFDAVEICGSAGYLISQFLSPVKNLREDAYGGSFENRCRFPLELIRAVRAAVGPDYPLLLRMGGNDFIPGSSTNVEAARFAALAEAAGVDALNVTGGWHESIVPQITGDLPRSGFSYLAAGVKRAVSIPVIASNRNNDPDRAEEVLALGRADMICLGRPLVADPDWCRKAEAGRPDLIRRCLGCNQGCLARTFFGRPLSCLVNGYAGREHEFKDAAPATRPKNILVVGAGPAGCEFAIQATRRGHRVTIWEKSSDLGGQLHLAAIPPAKQEFETLIDYYRAMLRELNVPVELGREATTEAVAAGGFDQVVVAVGSRARSLPLDVDGSVRVCTADDVLTGAVMPGRDVVVIGGGAVGCETAQYLADRGSLSADELKFLITQKAETMDTILGLLNRSDRRVAIVEVEKRIGRGFDPGCAGPVLREMKRLGVGRYPLAHLVKVSANVATVQQQTEEGPKTIELPCDTVIVAVGRVPDTALVDALRSQGIPVRAIGDGDKVGKVLDAIHAAIALAAEI